MLAQALFRRLRQWDRQTRGVNQFVANSRFIAERIHTCYGREAAVIYPPVDVDRFACCEEKADYYVTVSRLVSQKKVELIVEAFNRMRDKQLVVIGGGPRLDTIRRMAGDNITVTGHLPASDLTSYVQKARAFVFASLEDFGMVTVEAQACGTPVIAYGRGGSLEIVTAGSGLFFEEQSAASIIDAVQRFEVDPQRFTPRNCRRNALRFDRRVFLQSYAEFISQAQAGDRARPVYLSPSCNYV